MTDAVPPPMVVFCVDISASMSTRVNVPGAESMTRLQCVQSAICQQLETLRQQQPECIPVVITFGMEVSVYTAGGSRSVIGRRAHDDVEELIARGTQLGALCSEKAV